MAAPETPLMPTAMDRAPSPNPKPSSSAPAVLSPAQLQTPTQHHASAFSTPATVDAFSTPVQINGASSTVVPAGQAKATGDSLPNLGDMEAKCGGCQQVIDQDGGGVVVAFGSSLWHVDCFRCAKCKERVSADTNLLLLADGSPVCGNCSYQCYVCKQPITEEAIMTGDESYHAHCFTCRTCKRRIEELVFAKTSQGIYCMSCHNERVARSRRHAEAKRQRAARKEKEKEASARDESARGGEKDLGPKGETSPVHSSSSYLTSPNLPAPPSQQSPGTSPQITPSVSSTEFAATLVSQTNVPLQNHVNGLPKLPEGVESEGRARAFSADQYTARAASPSSTRRPAENTPLPASPADGHVRARTEGSIERNSQSRQPSSSRPAASSSNSNLSQRPSFSSTGPRPDNIGLGVGPVGTTPSSGLGVPITSKADRRRSINPAMSFNMDAANSTFSVEPRMSPLPPSPLRASFTDLQNEPPKSPSSPSPMQTNGNSFPFNRSASLASTAVKADNGQGPPPRSSSLSEQAIADFPRPEPTGQAPTFPRKSSSDDEAPAVPPKNEANKTEMLVTDLTDSPRTSMPPNLPPMSFSSSDSDFALILNGMDRSPHKIPMPQTSVPLQNGHHGPQGATSTESPPESPAKEAAPSISRSPQMDLLAAGAPMSAEASGSRSRLPTRSRLSPNDSMSPRYLRTRQTSAESSVSVSSRLGPDSAFSTLAEMIATAKHTQQESVTVDLSLLSSMLSEAEDLKDTLASLNRKYTGAKRTSQQYSEGLTVAGEEYDKEVSIRRELEAEVYKLRAQVHSQTARLSVMSGDERRQENMRRRSNDLANSLTGLERDISRLRAQRDMTLAEVEELHAKRDSLEPNEETAATLGQSLTHRLDTIKEQYREELEPLTAQREALQREIAELRESREQFLEESTALAAKNDELAELNAQLTRQSEAMQEQISRQRPTIFSKSSRSGLGHPAASPSMSSLNTAASTLQEVPEETARVVKVNKPEPVESVPARRFKWYGYKSSKGPDASTASASISRPILLKNGSGGTQRPSTEFGMRDHQFSQHSTMRFTKCEVCGEKMWGLQEVKCSLCGIVCHSKCGEKLPRSCPGVRSLPLEANDGPAAPSLFGRELTEQVVNDKVSVPVIVTKCIEAVEAVGMEYEGIYRKTGGSSQSKQITQLFERGDYDSFDLADIEAFNDISSVTSVLKTYFRSLPNPLLTHELHESFVAAATIRDAHNKHAALCALLKELPKDHYATLKVLMLHLNRVTSHSAINLMTSQNLGVVFGPTLMRSSDPTREFGDMAGKALSVQWMVDNAPQVFIEA